MPPKEKQENSFLYQLFNVKPERHANLTKQFYAQTQQGYLELKSIPRLPGIASQNLPVRYIGCRSFRCIRFVCTGGYNYFDPLLWLQGWCHDGTVHALDNNEDVQAKLYIDVRLANLMARCEAFQLKQNRTFYKVLNYTEYEHSRLVIINDELFLVQEEPTRLVVCEYDRPGEETGSYLEDSAASKMVFAKRFTENIRSYYEKESNGGNSKMPKQAKMLELEISELAANFRDKFLKSQASIGSIFGKQGNFAVYKGVLYTDIGSVHFDGIRKSAQMPPQKINASKHLADQKDHNIDGKHHPATSIYERKLYQQMKYDVQSALAKTLVPSLFVLLKNLVRKEIKYAAVDKQAADNKAAAKNKIEKLKDDFEEKKKKNQQNALGIYNESLQQTVSAPDANDDYWPQQHIEQSSRKVRQLDIDAKLADVKDLVDATWLCLPGEGEFAQHTLLAIGGKFVSKALFHTSKYEEPLFDFKKEIIKHNSGILLFGFESVDPYSREQTRHRAVLKEIINKAQLKTDNPPATVISYYKASDKSGEESAKEKKNFDSVYGNVYIVAGGFIFQYNPRLPSPAGKDSDLIRIVAKCQKRENYNCTNFNGKVYIYGGNSYAPGSKSQIEVFDPVTGILKVCNTNIESDIQPRLETGNRPMLTVLQPIVKEQFANRLVMFGGSINLSENNYFVQAELDKDGSWEQFGSNITTDKTMQEKRYRTNQLIFTDFEGVHRENSVEFMCVHLQQDSRQHKETMQIKRLVLTTDTSGRSLTYQWRLC